ncbi:SSI family serine proteinase inhibitor [Streptomyces alkaliphilus]|uniref:SSI family serine proteinase inhibitor n=1 Tax=Streptomyces alkaliphilus TaxID=1472722 RepID=UPI00117FA351|nr:SSI family serine proteinase inhibitor [Streptomyces alkaliphilus]MQS07059.1 hypothetical protein [Streptomyces alkaliphilus]
MDFTSLTAAALAALAALAAGPQAGAPAEPGEAGTAARPIAHDLRITVSEDGSRSSSRTHTLTCEPTGGDHPEAEAACEVLLGANTRGADLFAPIGPDTMCTQQHGGPATATVAGRWNGEQVRATFSRANGCEIARWDAMVPVLPSMVGQPS